MIQVESRRNVEIAEMLEVKQTWNETWLDQVFLECQKQDIKVE